VNPVTVATERSDDEAFIAHDQVSVPLDVTTGGALLNLQP
jgi:hypothetical protein